MSAEAKLAELLAHHKLEMPPAPKPQGMYAPLLVVNNLAFVAGHLPVRPTGQIVKGRLGYDLDIPAGYEAARLAGLGILATLRQALGSLDRVVRVAKLVGMVNCTPEFDQHPAVINGCSELLAEVFSSGAGVGARSSFGVASLPLSAAVEIEAVFEID